jgi:large subunit ribosomal protein L25
MAQRFTLQATRRTLTGKKVSQLRRDGKLPAVLYGRSLKEPIAVAMDRKEASNALKHITYSSLILVNLEGEEHTTLVRDFQVDTLHGGLNHVDFLVVSLTEKVKAEVSIIMEGKAPVIANMGGLLVAGLERVMVESLPQDLPEHFVVDVSGLANFGDSIHVRDLNVPANVAIVTDLDELLFVASAPVTEIVEEAAPAAVLAEGAVAAEGAVPAEGEAAAGAAPAAGAAAAAEEKNPGDKGGKKDKDKGDRR